MDGCGVWMGVGVMRMDGCGCDVYDVYGCGAYGCVYGCVLV